MYASESLGRSIHHRMDRSIGGTNAMSNLITLCGSGTTGCHGDMTELRPFDGPNEGGYWLRSWCDPLTHPVLYVTRRRIGTDPRWYLHDDGSLSDRPEQ